MFRVRAPRISFTRRQNKRSNPDGDQVTFGVDLMMWHRSIREVGPGLATLLSNGYPAYTTSPGWLGYSDGKLARLATQAVRQILAQYPGHWEIAVAERNVAAKAFWPRAIGTAPNVSQLVQFRGDGEHWRGPIWSFRSV